MSRSQVFVLQALLLSLVLCIFADATGFRVLEARDGALAERAPARRLAAAHMRTPIKSRNSEQVLRHEHELHYLEGTLKLEIPP